VSSDFLVAAQAVGESAAAHLDTSPLKLTRACIGVTRILKLHHMRLRCSGIAAPFLALLDPQFFHEVRIVRPQLLDCRSESKWQHRSATPRTAVLRSTRAKDTSAATPHLGGFTAASSDSPRVADLSSPAVCRDSGGSDNVDVAGESALSRQAGIGSHMGVGSSHLRWARRYFILEHELVSKHRFGQNDINRSRRAIHTKLYW